MYVVHFTALQVYRLRTFNVKDIEKEIKIQINIEEIYCAIEVNVSFDDP